MGAIPASMSLHLVELETVREYQLAIKDNGFKIKCSLSTM